MTIPVRMIASTRHDSATLIWVTSRAWSAPVRASITLLPSADSSSVIASTVSLKIDWAMSGTRTAISRDRLDASAPALRLGI